MAPRRPPARHDGQRALRPGLRAQTVNDIMTARQLVGRHAIATVEQALELAGGAGFYRDAGLERRFRDIQGARYHAMQRGAQSQYAGAMALGESVATVF